MCTKSPTDNAAQSSQTAPPGGIVTRQKGRAVYYKYSGNISSYSITKPHTVSIADMVLYKHGDHTVAPTRVQAFGELAEYIHELECTDDEERYLEWDFYYNKILCLQYIIIPASDTPHRPAKIIVGSQVGDSCESEFRIFGNPEHITTDHPQAMSAEEYSAWYDYKYQHFSRR